MPNTEPSNEQQIEFDDMKEWDTKDGVNEAVKLMRRVLKIAEAIDQRQAMIEQSQEKRTRSVWQAFWKGIGVIKAEIEIIFGWKK